MRRGHEGSGSGASGAAMSSTSMKYESTGPMPSRSCATFCIAGSDGAVPPLRRWSSETRTYSGTWTGFLSQAVDVDHVHAYEFRRRLIVWVATSPTCATNLSLRALVCVQLTQGAHVELDKTTLLVEGMVHGDGCLGDDGERRTAAQPVGAAREEGASPSISIRSKSRAASTTLPSMRLVAASACPRMLRWDCMYSV